MSNAFQVWNSWFSLASQAALLPLQTQSVIALRLMRLAGGGALARSEGTPMVTEKEQALEEEQAVPAGGSVTGRNRRHIAKKSMAGRNRRHTAKKVVGVYKKRVRGNRRRLAR